MNDRPFDPRRAVLCLGHRSRLNLVGRLVQGRCCVTDLAHEVALSQSCTTRHLQALERAGLVVGTRQGKRVLYALGRDPVELGGLMSLALGLAVRADPGPRPTNGPARFAVAEPKRRPTRAAARRPTAILDADPDRGRRDPVAATPPEPATSNSTARSEPGSRATDDMEDWLL